MLSAFLRQRKAWLALAAGLFLVVFGLYSPSLRFAFIAWDEMGLIYFNPIVKAINATTISRAFTTFDPELYIPLTFLSYQVDYAIGGLHPFVFHLTNLILHALNSALVAWVSYLLAGALTSAGERRRMGIGIIVGLLFAIHPLNVEAVAWIPGRKDLLSSFWFLLSFGLYLRFRQTPDGRKILYAASVVCFLLALLSKVTVLSLPILLLLLEGALWMKRTGGRRFAATLPYFLLSILFGIIGLVGKKHELASSSSLDLLLLAAKSTGFYVQKLFWPVHLSPMYPLEGNAALASPDVWIPLALAVLILVSLPLLARRHLPSAFGVAFFFVALAPSFFNVMRNGEVFFADDRYAYLPSVGLLFAAVMVMVFLLFQLGKVHRAVFAAFVAVAVLLAGRTWDQIRVWRDSESLFSYVLSLTPRALSARVNLGLVYLQAQKLDEAKTQLEAAQEIRPLAGTWNALGQIALQQGKIVESTHDYQEALTLEPSNAEAFAGLGDIASEQGKKQEAIANYERAVASAPGYAGALNNLGKLYLEAERLPEALELLRRAAVASPGDPDVRFNYAVALAKNGDTGTAIGELEQVVKLKPGDEQAQAVLSALRAAEGSR